MGASAEQGSSRHTDAMTLGPVGLLGGSASGSSLVEGSGAWPGERGKQLKIKGEVARARNSDWRQKEVPCAFLHLTWQWLWP